MIETFRFLNKPWLWQVIIVALFLLTIFGIKEWLQSGKRRFYIKIVVALFGLIALALIVLKPAIPNEVNTSHMAILTQDYNQSKLDSLQQEYKGLRVQNYKTGQPIFSKVNPPTSVFVLGQGIAKFDLWQLDDLKTTFIYDALPSGISKSKYNKNESSGNALNIKGEYQRPNSGNRLVLEDPSGIGLDSIILNSEDTQKFQLKAALNVKGNFIYALTEKDSLGRQIQSDPLPIQVSDLNALSILIINGFPTFETKYLKNYLAEMGHRLAVRSQITKGRFKFEYFNQTSRPQTALNEKNLEGFDLVILDARSLQNLSRVQRTALGNAIKNEGLGLLIQPTQQLFGSSNTLMPFSFESDRRSETRIDLWPKIALSKYPYAYKETQNLHPIHGSSNTICSAFVFYGTGKIGTTTLENTYALVLNGKTKVYQKIWSDIITFVSKKDASNVDWDSDTNLAYRDQPFHFTLRTQIENPIVKHQEGYTIPLQQDISIPQLWRGITYPKTNGWHHLVVTQDTTEVFYHYVLDTLQWSSVNARDRIIANERHFEQQTSSSKVQTYLKPIDPIWFYLVFLCCIGYLWLEPKL